MFLNKYGILQNKVLSTSVVDPDPDQVISWIRIRIKLYGI
jgi:hypothetical protein